MFAKISQILKAINAGFVAIAPTKVERVTADNCEIIDLEFVRNSFRLQGPLARPFVHALRAGAYASQSSSLVVAHAIISPGDPQLRIALLRNFARLNCLPSFCDVSHLDLLRRLLLPD